MDACWKKDPIEPFELSYEIAFGKDDVKLQYDIGMTNRNLKTKGTENIADIKYNKKSIASANIYNIEYLQIN